MRVLRQLMSDLRGATAIEYGLIAALISVALISGYGAITGSLLNTFNTVETHITKSNS
ncbi:Flp family type IVb pilin [Rhizobium sp. AQ_MP]|uniref:Flp family type IVb pilin n=1 Tax=Rhizobium sp. AQ_MP TaxID=2761536 RepID=UPI00163B111A|nr:Flp family type IVb pilin [Rhizobium sp. AQ_MP]MBC2772780.1 Flp family type IVb pilin [Rhizobium sp. AQ_MP]